MHKNCILTGGAGFIGTNVARGLLAEGYRVTVVDRFLSRFFTQSGIIDKVAFRQCDYLDFEKLKPVMKNQDILFHFAYSSLPGTPISRIEEDVADNVAGSVKLFKLAVETGVSKIVFPSSGGTVYGDEEKMPIREDFPTNPICFHGISKLMIEKYLFLFKRIYGIDYLLYRIANAYGPGQNPNGEQGLMANAIFRMCNDEPVVVYGKGDAVRDYVHIDDVVKAFTAGIKGGLKNDVFNIGTGKGYSINEVVEIISKTLGIRPRIAYSASRQTDVRSNILSPDKIKSAVAWKPEVTIEEGIKNACLWMKDNLPS